jgi:uncharacterized damage-inducible protein DinB
VVFIYLFRSEPVPLAVNLIDLIAYTDWQRAKWHVLLRQHADALQTTVGPNGDGRFANIGDLVKHVFSAEKRYVDRLSNRPLTDPASIPNDVEARFAFGRQSRQALREFIDSLPATEWDIAQEHTLLGRKLRLTPRKIVVHVVLHEIRHWAQIATLLRLN